MLWLQLSYFCNLCSFSYLECLSILGLPGQAGESVAVFLEIYFVGPTASFSCGGKTFSILEWLLYGDETETYILFLPLVKKT